MLHLTAGIELVIPPIHLQGKRLILQRTKVARPEHLSLVVRTRKYLVEVIPDALVLMISNQPILKGFNFIA